ncbi:MAG TPA: hypothetical protein VIO32_08165, partial [Candidatus Baltobacteraceae bacterium]
MCALAAGAAQPASAQSSAAAILAGISARNPSLQSFQARVHVDVRMLNFPWLSPKLDGTSYYKRPQSYEVVFDRVPSYAHGINKLFGDIDDVAAWEKDWNIAYTGVQNVAGKPYFTLRMTKKIYSDQTADTIAYVDPATYQVARMDWHYRNGGTITMTQTYRQQGEYSVVGTQHADIHIPHVHAVADATYGEYQTNVAISDAVFTGK